MTNHEDMANVKNMQITEEIENLEKKVNRKKIFLAWFVGKASC